MKNSFPLRITLAIFALATCSIAIQPNYVQTTTYAVGMGANLVTTDYSDGLGRTIQSKLALKPDATSQKDRVTCTFYDDAGRPFITTKPFIDRQYTFSYLPGTITDQQISDQLKAAYNNEPHAYAETEYWDDPLGRVKKVIAPGAEFAGFESRSWTFGVPVITAPFTLTATGGSAQLENGLVTAVTATDITAFFDALYTAHLDPTFFSATPTHFLTVSVSFDGVLNNNIPTIAKIAEELKDVFGRTVQTLSDPTINGVTGKKISSSYLHDILGNVLDETPPVTDNALGTTHYQYNTLGQMVWKQTPDGGMFEYSYRDDGQLDEVLSYVTPEKKLVRKVRYSYDAIGRLIHINSVFPSENGEIPLDQVNYYYDDLTDVRARPVFKPMPESYFAKLTNLKGRLVARESINHVDRTNAKQSDDRIIVGEAYSYDEEGRVIMKFLTITGSPLVQENYYTYDIHGKLLLEAFSYGGDNIVKHYTYDELGRLVSVKHGKLQPDGMTYTYNEIVAHVYDALGRDSVKKLSAVTPTPVATTYDYDILDRSTKIATNGTSGFTETIGTYNAAGKLTNSGFSKGGNISNLHYRYNAANLALDYNYTYDNINRLTASQRIADAGTPENNAYAYDNLGRFKEKHEGLSDLTGYSYHTGTSRLKNTSKNSTAGKEYIYDKHGNLVVDFTKNMVIEYDWRDMPIRYRFYNDLSDAGLTFDSFGTYSVNDDIYTHMAAKVSGNIVKFLSSVLMVYDADGNRICKMDVKE